MNANDIKQKKNGSKFKLLPKFINGIHCERRKVFLNSLKRRTFNIISNISQQSVQQTIQNIEKMKVLLSIYYWLIEIRSIFWHMSLLLLFFLCFVLISKLTFHTLNKSNPKFQKKKPKRKRIRSIRLKNYMACGMKHSWTRDLD